jgi:Zn-dependent peptidase ImmA (M78 family)
MRRIFRDKIAPHALRKIRAFRLNPPQSIKKLAEDLGLSVVEIEMPISERGYLTFAPELGSTTGYVIYVNINSDIGQKRWTVAHELGHYFLHREEREHSIDPETHLDFRFDYFGIEHLEREANYFAEDMFFGEGALDAALSLHGPAIDYLASKVFGVPRKVLQIAVDFRSSKEQKL